MKRNTDLDIILVNKINTSKKLVDKVKKFLNTNDTKKRTLALAYINEASSLMSVVESVYYNQLENLMRNDYEDLFNDFHKLVGSVFDAYDNNFTATEINKFFVDFDNSYNPFSKIQL